MSDTAAALKTAIQHHAQGDLAAAQSLYQQILAADPNHVNALHLLGVIDSQQGRHDRAIERIARAIELAGDDAVLYGNLGNAWMNQGNDRQAIACYRRAVALNPNFADAHYNLGNALRERRNMAEAIECYRRALELKPDNAEACNNLGIALQHQGALADSVTAYRRALTLKPEFAEAVNNLGSVLQAQACVDEAILCHQRALELKPDYATGYCNLGSAFKDRGNLQDAIVCCRRAMELKPSYVMPLNNLLLTMQYRPGVTPGELATAHAQFERLHAAPLRTTWPAHPNRPDSDRRLRVGFVSADFGRHPVGYFLAHVLEQLDLAQIETVLYSDRVTGDETTTRLMSAAAIWRESKGQSDEELAGQILADAVDILFDLAGHTAKNRLLAFARKPAPIQVTWLGYVGTTGLAAMDYILADRFEIPPKAEQHYGEKVLRMPDGYVCYEPPANAPPVASLPAPQNGYVTFGCFNNPSKITSLVIELWSRVLQHIPTSRLVLKYRGMGEQSLRQRLETEFAKHGIDPARVECLGASPHAQLLAEYGRIDLALDTFPYSGGLTTCEALWMGVPVITCPGETFASRHSFSHLSNAGLTKTIAASLDEYVELAVAGATDLNRLAQLRSRLRQQMASSPLCDANKFAANFTTALRQIWRDWCNTNQRQETKNP